MTREAWDSPSSILPKTAASASTSPDNFSSISEQRLSLSWMFPRAIVTERSEPLNVLHILLNRLGGTAGMNGYQRKRYETRGDRGTHRLPSNNIRFAHHARCMGAFLGVQYCSDTKIPPVRETAEVQAHYSHECQRRAGLASLACTGQRICAKEIGYGPRLAVVVRILFARRLDDTRTVSGCAEPGGTHPVAFERLALA